MLCIRECCYIDMSIKLIEQLLKQQVDLLAK